MRSDNVYKGWLLIFFLFFWICKTLDYTNEPGIMFCTAHYPAENPRFRIERYDVWKSNPKSHMVLSMVLVRADIPGGVQPAIVSRIP